jgi:CrcB protein
VTPESVLAVAAGAAVGAPVRFAVERWLGAAWPWGTWLVNVVGSAVLGVLVGLTSARPDTSVLLVSLVGVGFCGALTTFGGFAAQVLDLAGAPRDVATARRAWRSLGYAHASVGGCLAVAAAAYITTRSSLGR